MTDIQERFERLRKEIDRLPVPDFDRSAAVSARGRAEPRFGPMRRIGTVTLALFVAVASTYLVVRAFGGANRVDTQRTTQTSSPETFDPIETARIPVGPQGQTNAILAAGGSIWVTAYGVEGGFGLDDSVLVRIDPATDRVRQTIPIHASPSWTFGGDGVAVGFDSIWIAGAGTIDGDGQTLLDRIDPRTGDVLATISLQVHAGAADVAVNTHGVWVTTRTDTVGELVRVDPANNAVVDRIPLMEEYVRDVAATNDAVIVEELVWTDGEGPCGVLTSVDPTTRAVVARAVLPGCGMTRLQAWQGQVWGTTGSGLVPIDPSTALPTDEGYDFKPGHNPRSFLLPTETGIWYAAYPGGNGERPDRLSRIDPDTGLITEYPVVVGALAAVMDGDSIWALSFDGTVTRIDLRPS